MATGSALDSQVGFAEETVPGTAVTVTLFHEHDSVTLKNSPTWSDPSSLRAGGRYVRRVGRQRQTRDSVTGSVTIPVATKGMSLLFKHCVASSTAALNTGTQVHAFGGTWAGKSLTVQAGYPEPVSPYTVRPITFAGCKVVSWEFSCSTGEDASLTLDLDGTAATTATALATAAYLATNNVYNFGDCTTATLAGTSLITAGLVMNSLSIKGEFPLATERQGLGFGKGKAEQLLIGIPMITATLGGEFNKAALYDPFLAETSQAFVATFTQPTYSLSFNIPAAKIKDAGPEISGPEIVTNSVELQGLDDETLAPITITVVQPI